MYVKGKLLAQNQQHNQKNMKTRLLCFLGFNSNFILHSLLPYEHYHYSLTIKWMSTGSILTYWDYIY